MNSPFIERIAADGTKHIFIFSIEQIGLLNWIYYNILRIATHIHAQHFHSFQLCSKPILTLDISNSEVFVTMFHDVEAAPDVGFIDIAYEQK